MSGILERSLGILELLVEHPEGVPVSAIATRLDVPVSAAHRLLKELGERGYVRQLRDQGDYQLTIKLAALGLAFVGRAGVTDIAQPSLDRLAAHSQELVRMSVIDDDALVWVGVAQGATTGLRYDPGREQGVTVHLASSAGGRAWLATMSDEEAVERAARQGIAPDFDAGPNAPRTVADLLPALAATRARGFAIATDSYLAGMAAMAVPIFRARSEEAIGCLSIAGPAVRLLEPEMHRLLPALRDTAQEIGSAAEASAFFKRPATRPTPTGERRRA